MNTQRSAKLSFLFMASVVLGGITWGQHLPEEQVAKSPTEYALCGINIQKTLFTAAVQRLGPPTGFRVVEILKGARPAGAVAYVWQKNGVRIQATAYYYEENGKRIEDVLYSVKVWGARPTQDGVGRTGVGLALGDTLRDVKKYYGDRFFQSKTTKGLTHVQLEWTDGTELHLQFDAQGRISYMQLIANVE